MIFLITPTDVESVGAVVDNLPARYPTATDLFAHPRDLMNLARTPDSTARDRVQSVVGGVVGVIADVELERVSAVLHGGGAAAGGDDRFAAAVSVREPRHVQGDVLLG